MEKDVLRYNDVFWNLSGLFTHDAALLFYYDLLKQCGIKLNISVHGNIPCLWNSGRIIQSVSPEYQKRCLEEYAKREIPVLLTFSNYLVSKAQLADTKSNEILDLASKYPLNGIISGSELLSDYIKGKHPHMFQSTSILRVVHEHGKGIAAYYDELASKYDRVVLHPDDGFNQDVIRNISHKEKIEILVNENCVRNCAMREKHCDIVSKYYFSMRQSEYFDALNDFKKKNCKSVQDVSALKKFISGNIHTCNMTFGELNASYRLGCRNYKIQGRSLSVASMMYDVTKYMLMDHVAGTVFKMIMDRIGSFAYSEDKGVLTAGFFEWERI